MLDVMTGASGFSLDEHLAALRINKSQYQDLQQFRELVKDILKPEHDDYYLVRWMRARGFDIQKAEDMIRKSIAWRERWGADSILTDWKCPDVVERHDIGGHCGYDKQGRPVWIYKSALLDTKGLHCSVNRREMLKRYIYKMESCYTDLKGQSQKLNKRVDKAIIINDLEGFTLQHLFQPGMDIVLRIFAMVESNYPETLQRAYVINAPLIFPMVFKICKPFMHEETRKRIVILGGDWKTKLLEEIEADQLPVHWGGTKIDPVNGDPYCSSMIGMGGKVPEENYLKGSQLVDDAEIKKVKVNATNSVDLEFKVDKGGVALRYTFWTEDYDIKFGIFRKVVGGKPAELLRIKKYNSHLIPEDGMIQCEHPATYIFQFDNSYSWFHSKEISYAIQVVDPENISTSE